MKCRKCGSKRMKRADLTTQNSELSFLVCQDCKFLTQKNGLSIWEWIVRLFIVVWLLWVLSLIAQ